MKLAANAIPNHLLRNERELRGWSQSYLAEQIDAPAPTYISRWERGTASPSPYYRERLCRIFEKNAQELGLLTQEVVAEIQTSEEEQETQSESFVEVASTTLTSVQNQPPLSDTSARDDRQVSAQKASLPGVAGLHFSKRWIVVGVILLLICSVGIPFAVFASSQQKHQVPLNSSTRIWPAISFNLNIKSAKVRAIQLMLKSHGYDIGFYGVDGIFGAQTEYAVRAFQGTHSLPITGVVNGPTWEKLITPSIVGQRGDYVRAVQDLLNASKMVQPFKIDGDFGSQTVLAVRQFQTAKHLPVSGRVDADTWCMLVGGRI